MVTNRYNLVYRLLPVNSRIYTVDWKILIRLPYFMLLVFLCPLNEGFRNNSICSQMPKYIVVFPRVFISPSCCILKSTRNCDRKDRQLFIDNFYKKFVLKNFTNLTGKHLCRNLIFKKETPTEVFSCKFCEFLRPFLQNTS